MVEEATRECEIEMKKIEGCLECGACKSKCPYELDTPNLLKKNYEDYKRVLAGEVEVQTNDESGNDDEVDELLASSSEEVVKEYVAIVISLNQYRMKRIIKSIQML